MEKLEPAFIDTRNKGLLAAKIEAAYELLTPCRLCPRDCRVDRSRKRGTCGAPDHAVVSSFTPHFGEEPPITGINGSGTIFFTHCNLRCRFCQNWDISIQGRGETASTDELAAVMLHLQRQGCHNINLVTPSHMIPFILKALDLAAGSGLTIPLVYNSSGYDSLETLKLLRGVVGIYMPDFKFWDPDIAKQACNAPDYPEVARIALKEMWNQTGDLKTDDRGIARTGLLVRHLVLPDDLAGTRDVLTFLSEKISPKTRVNVMSQYRPMGDARKITGFSRPVSVDEFHDARRIAENLGLYLVR